METYKTAWLQFRGYFSMRVTHSCVVYNLDFGLVSSVGLGVCGVDIMLILLLLSV